MLGVNLEEAWNQASLIGPPPSINAKSSKYTVPLNQLHGNSISPQFISPAQRSAIHGGGGAGGGGNYHSPHQPPPPMLEQFGNSDRPDVSQDYNNQQQYLKADATDIPISNPVYTQQIMQGNANNNPPPPQEVPSPALLEIPRLKEQLTQQSTYMMDCQREVLFMKNLIQQLKKELNDSRQQQERNRRKKKWMKVMWMALLFVMVFVVLVVVVQVMQKINVLLTQPVMY
jgi:hypothetical protein